MGEACARGNRAVAQRFRPGEESPSVPARISNSNSKMPIREAAFLFSFAAFFLNRANAYSGGDVFVPDDYKCEVYESCSSCIADINCGWCAVENTCVQGNGRRPINHTASCNAYEYGFCSGVSCRVYPNCGLCSSDPLCAWCASQGVCTEAEGNMPLFVSCPIAFISDPNECHKALSAYQGSREKAVGVRAQLSSGEGVLRDASRY